MKSIKNEDYKLWTVSEVVDWIVGLNKAKYSKYKEDLIRNMKNEQFNGSYLEDVEKNDLHRLGITGFKDKKDIFNCLQELINNDNGVVNYDQEGQNETPLRV